jgi:hypothetical protein
LAQVRTYQIPVLVRHNQDMNAQSWAGQLLASLLSSPGTELGMLAPGSVALPVGDTRCATCMHPLRELIEAHLDAGTRAPAIGRILTDRGVRGPSTESIRNHHRRHRAPLAAVRRVQQATAQLDLILSDVEELRLADIALAAGPLQIPGRSPADAPGVHA